ncbi:aminotransferase class I/II-fold pyridoxal phosphate-dependent enzyme [Anaerosphaera multitolerans]|uniref:Aluminum resistance protein n=1 Tax=Anaerosphaera multitolerans TaxID=2487351 RepID=A0A437S559_9FIRM|nr:methionine gamma-lyase family protein [Anaerosphaera multitolerans]RVU54149.1 hypothetical protein EF514_08720 [Anaerosphaera multitolerans]
MEIFKEFIFENYEIDNNICDFVEECEKVLSERFKELNDISQYNQVKILKSMQNHKLQATDFNWTTGYGYGDIGREKVEKIYSDIFNTEDALVRPNIVSGTHAISLSLFGILRSGDHLLSASGKPYDTLLKVIGVTGDEPGNMMEQGIKYSEVPMVRNEIDIEAVKKAIQSDTKVVMLQRSTGYSDRKALSTEQLKRTIESIKNFAPNIIIFVDNCYGEFTDITEPSDFGADIVAGSLIKNPGGGLAYSGGYIVGKQKYINLISNRLTAPGIGKECGLTFGITRQILQGLFLAPKVVEDAIKSALLFSVAFEKLGYECFPNYREKRSDIILSIKLNDPEKLCEFCRAIQFASPVDAHFTPEPWDMPGYDNKVIMAAGDFIEGSSIELSADGPMREPYYVYYQGGLTYYHGKFALMKVLSNFKSKNYIDI